MKTNSSAAKMLFGLAALCLLSACASLRDRQVVERTDPYRDSMTQVKENYDTFGRRWGSTQVVQNVVPPPAPAQPPRPPAPENKACSAITTGLVNLTMNVPAEATIGQEFMCELNPTATECAANVVITDRLPTGVSYVRSDPAAQVQGDHLVWNLGDMERGDSRPIKVWLKADQEGRLVTCAAIAAEPRACGSTVVGKPTLALTKTGPALIRLGDDVSYMIAVSNNGTAVAKDVVVTDVVPDGLVDESGKSELVFNVGDLGPNQSKTFPVTLKSTKRGQVCNVAVAKSSNAGEVKAEACSTAALVSLKITKDGDKQLLIGKTATYNITVTNDGDVDMNDLKVTDTAPDQSTFISAEGASISGNSAVWNLPSLAKGAQQSYQVKLTSRVPGNRCNTATLDTAKGIQFTAQACTEWIGITGLLVELLDDPDPIQVGETSTYTIRVTNQGSNAAIEGLNIKAIFKDEVDPMSASSGGTIEGKVVTWPTVPTVPPKQAVTVTVVGKGVKVGDHRLESQVTTRIRTNPIVSFESTTVY